VVVVVAMASSTTLPVPMTMLDGEV
jgi:hypothetical protein